MRHPEDQGRRRSGLAAFRVDRHMLWRCIEMRLDARCGRRGGPCLAGADPATWHAFPPGPVCALLCPRSAGVGLRHPSGPFAAPCGVCGAPSMRRASADAWRRGPGSPLTVWMREDRYVPTKIKPLGGKVPRPGGRRNRGAAVGLVPRTRLCARGPYDGYAFPEVRVAPLRHPLGAEAAPHLRHRGPAERWSI
jgi:hypothetical protein